MSDTAVEIPLTVTQMEGDPVGKSLLNSLRRQIPTLVRQSLDNNDKRVTFWVGPQAKKYHDAVKEEVAKLITEMAVTAQKTPPTPDVKFEKKPK